VASDGSDCTGAEVAVRGGRPKIPGEIRRLIREMSLANRLWGAPRVTANFSSSARVAVDGCQVHGEEWARAVAYLEDLFCTTMRQASARWTSIVPTVGFRLLSFWSSSGTNDGG
jgi:hypothetical protein